MPNAKQTKRATPGSRETLLHMLETLPDAFFVVDDTETIVYANTSAQTLTGTTREEVCGTSLWCGAPHLVSPSLYQAVQKAKQTREPTEVGKRSQTAFACGVRCGVRSTLMPLIAATRKALAKFSIVISNEIFWCLPIRSCLP
ncbi:MAG TPA: PAS domain-containing protein [Ktedonobacteraceae bacterium]|nr:PAS domain-containing protein [Ktedonobacteraceae bacterium]